MQKYENRLILCGYSRERAHSICVDFVRNLTLVDLESFVISVEKSHVARV